MSAGFLGTWIRGKGVPRSAALGPNTEVSSVWENPGYSEVIKPDRPAASARTQAPGLKARAR